MELHNHNEVILYESKADIIGEQIWNSKAAIKGTVTRNASNIHFGIPSI